MARILFGRRKLSLLLAAFAVLGVACGTIFGLDSTTAEQVWDKRVERGMGDETCEATPHELPEGVYAGPLIDTHLHIPHIPDARPIEEELSSPFIDVANSEDINRVFPQLGVTVTMAEIACTLQNEGTDGAIAFFSVFQGTRPHSLEVVKRSTEAYPDLFFPFINALGNEDGVPTIGNEDLVATLAVEPGLFDGYGEIALYGDASRPSAGPDDSPPDSELFDGIFETARQEGLTIYTHPGFNQEESFAAVLAAYPDVNFIVHGEQIEDSITDLMARFPNIYFTVNDLYGDQYLLHPAEHRESFLEAISDTKTLLERDLARWKEPIEKYPDQFLWGTDRGGIAVWTFDLEVGRGLSDYGRAFISRLDLAVQEKFAYRNALEALGKSRLPELE